MVFLIATLFFTLAEISGQYSRDCNICISRIPSVHCIIRIVRTHGGEVGHQKDHVR